MLIVSIPPILLLGSGSYYQEKKNENYAVKNFVNSSMESTKTQIENKIEHGNSILTALSFNNALGIMFNEEQQNLNLYRAYLSFKNVYDPLLNMISDLTPEVKEIIFFTDSKLNVLRKNIHSLNEANSYPFKNNMKYTISPKWYVDNNYVYGMIMVPKEISSDTTIAISLVYDKQVFFEELASKNTLVNYEITKDNKVIYSEGALNKNKNNSGEKEIASTDWQIRALVNKNADLEARVVNWTFLSVLFSILLTFGLMRFFINLISENFLLLRDKIKHFNKKGEKPEYFFTNQKDEFGELSNEVGNMLIELQEMNDRVNQAELKQEKSNYDALVNQINSHFLYNTLSMINWQAIESNNENISFAIQELSKFYRTTLNRGKSITTVKNEIDNIKAYINLHLMLNDNFQINYEIDPKLLECQVINLMLQPIVENIFEHGVKSGRDFIKILISVTENHSNRIIISITDSGKGIPVEVLQTILNEGGPGYGLMNVNKRIKFFFGEEFGLQIKSEKGNGTTVNVILPKIIENVEKDN